MQSTITFGRPVHFTLGWKIFMNLFSSAPGFLILFILGIGLPASALTNSPQLFALTMASALTVLAFDRFFMPFTQGNFLLPSRFPNKMQGFITQITFTPRRHQGIEGILDDADDFGVFSVEGDFVVFRGESTHLAVHKNDLAGIRLQNAGWRGMWMLGNSARFFLKQPVSNVIEFIVHTREGNTLISANRSNRAFCDYLANRFSWNSGP